MNKAELIKVLAREADITQGSVDIVLSTLAAVIGKELAINGRQEITGLGTFKVSQRAARVGRNPKTGAPADIPAKNMVKFKAAPALKEAVA